MSDMLSLKITEQSLQIGQDAVHYASPYMNQKTLRTFLKKWVTLVHGLSGSEDVIFLPFSLDDEFIQAFRATLSGSRITLRCVVIDGISIDPEEDVVDEAIFNETCVLKEYPEIFGVFDQQDLIGALEAV